MRSQSSINTVFFLVIASEECQKPSWVPAVDFNISLVALVLEDGLLGSTSLIEPESRELTQLASSPKFYIRTAICCLERRTLIFIQI